MTLDDFLKSDKEKKVRIAVVGDAIVDEYYYANVKRISPEFPIPVVQTPHTNPDYALPGGASNVLYQMRHFNVDARLISLLDQYSKIVFQRAGLNTSCCVEMKGYIPRKCRFYSKDFPMFRWDIEQPNYGLDDNQLNLYLSELFAQPIRQHFDVVILSDYDKGLFGATHKFHNFLYAGIQTIVDPKGKDIRKWDGCTIFKPNSVEAEILSGKKDWKDQCHFFLTEVGCRAVVITQEGEGVVGISDGIFFEYRPKRKLPRAESVIGAGDCFVSFLAMAVGRGFPVDKAAEIAFEAGSLYVKRKHNEPIKPNQLSKTKITHPEDIKHEGKLVFTNGCFDAGLTRGHIECLKFAKDQGDCLIVAINSDDSVKRLKGDGRPIMSLQERMDIVSSLECVDYVTWFEEDTPLSVIQKIKPDVIVKGGDYKPEDVVGYGLADVMICPLYDCLSTTEKIKLLK